MLALPCLGYCNYYVQVTYRCNINTYFTNKYKSVHISCIYVICDNSRGGSYTVSLTITPYGKDTLQHFTMLCNMYTFTRKGFFDPNSRVSLRLIEFGCRLPLQRSNITVRATPRNAGQLDGDSVGKTGEECSQRSRPTTDFIPVQLLLTLAL